MSKVPDFNSAEGVWVAHGPEGSTTYDFDELTVETPIGKESYSEDEWQDNVVSWLGFVTGNVEWEKVE